MTWGVPQTFHERGLTTTTPLVSNLCKVFYKVWASCSGGRLSPKRGEQVTEKRVAERWPK